MMPDQEQLIAVAGRAAQALRQRRSVSAAATDTTAAKRWGREELGSLRSVTTAARNPEDSTERV